MKYLIQIFRIPAALTLVVAALFVIFTARSTPANEQQRWTGHIDNQAYLDQYYGRSSEVAVSTYSGSSTGYSHRAGYGGLTTIIVERPRQDCPFGVEYRYGNTSIFYCNGYRPNYDDPYRRVYVSPRYYRPGYPYYRPGYPKYKKHYYKHDKYNKRYYYNHDRHRYGKPFDDNRHRHKYVAPKHPGYKSRHNQQYRQHRIQVPRKKGFPTRGDSYRHR